MVFVYSEEEGPLVVSDVFDGPKPFPGRLLLAIRSFTLTS